jgi:hypothetical protein
LDKGNIVSLVVSFIYKNKKNKRKWCSEVLVIDSEVRWLEMQIEAIQERSRRETRIQSLLQAAIQFIFIRKNEQRHYRCGTPITKIEGNHQLQRGN